MATTAEVLRYLTGELVADGYLERDGETLTTTWGGREFMVEIKVFDVTQPTEQEQ